MKLKFFDRRSPPPSDQETANRLAPNLIDKYLKSYVVIMGGELTMFSSDLDSIKASLKAQGLDNQVSIFKITAHGLEEIKS